LFMIVFLSIVSLFSFACLFSGAKPRAEPAAHVAAHADPDPAAVAPTDATAHAPADSPAYLAALQPAHARADPICRAQLNPNAPAIRSSDVETNAAPLRATNNHPDPCSLAGALVAAFGATHAPAHQGMARNCFGQLFCDDGSCLRAFHEHVNAFPGAQPKAVSRADPSSDGRPDPRPVLTPLAGAFGAPNVRPEPPPDPLADPGPHGRTVGPADARALAPPLVRAHDSPLVGADPRAEPLAYATTVPAANGAADTRSEPSPEPATHAISNSGTQFTTIAFDLLASPRAKWLTHKEVVSMVLVGRRPASTRPTLKVASNHKTLLPERETSTKS
jgi:hypothetical protein